MPCSGCSALHGLNPNKKKKKEKNLHGSGHFTIPLRKTPAVSLAKFIIYKIIVYIIVHFVIIIVIISYLALTRLLFVQLGFRQIKRKYILY